MVKEGKKREKDKKLKQILSEQLSLIKPTGQEFLILKKQACLLKDKIESSAKKLKIKAGCFIGGSLAKGTIIKKERYDIDIFVRFEKNQKQKEAECISESLEKILKHSKVKFQRIHGSRDYFIIQEREKGGGKGKEKTKSIFFEIIPVLKIAKPQQAENTTDLSFFHVSYIMKETRKNPKLADEIMLAKAFCHAQGCYGAESYISGFSGYALELLICNYKSFANFIKQVAGSTEKIVIDKEKLYKNRQDVLLNMNEAKLQSPVVLVDPTFKERNALAALSDETFEKFRKACLKFLKAPSRKFFQQKKINEKQFNFILEAETEKQAGDIAGSKLIKFCRFLSMEIDKLFVIKKANFEYDESRNTGIFYLSLKRKKEIILEGPPAGMQERLASFRKAHKNVFIKRGKAYAREKADISFGQFLKMFKKENSRKIKEMGITNITVKS